MGGLREVGQRDASNPSFEDLSFGQHFLACSLHQDPDTQMGPLTPLSSVL